MICHHFDVLTVTLGLIGVSGPCDGAVSKMPCCDVQRFASDASTWLIQNSIIWPPNGQADSDTCINPVRYNIDLIFLNTIYIYICKIYTYIFRSFKGNKMRCIKRKQRLPASRWRAWEEKSWCFAVRMENPSGWRGGFHQWGYPQMDGFWTTRKSHLEMDDVGVPPF